MYIILKIIRQSLLNCLKQMPGYNSTNYPPHYLKLIDALEIRTCTTFCEKNMWLVKFCPIRFSS